MDRLQNRNMSVKLILDNGVFPSNNSNVKDITCNDGKDFCAAEVIIMKQGSGYSAISCVLIIHGMDFDDCCSFVVMQQKRNWNLSKNSIEVYAGNQPTNKSLPPLLFKGSVLKAMLPKNPTDTNGAFIIMALQGGVEINEWSEPTSISGEISKVFALKSIIAKSYIGYSPSISPDVTGVVKDVVLEGNWREQLTKFCQKFNLEFRIDVIDGQNVVMVAPPNKPFVKQTTEISEQNNNLIGLPDGSDMCIQVDTWFDSTLIFGQLVELKTVITPLNGTYLVTGMRIELSNNSDSWYNHLELTGQNK